MPEGSILALDMETLVRIGIQWINVGILTFFLVRILYNPVKNFMAGRAERIRNDIDSARKSNDDAQKLKAEYEQKLADIRNEKEAMLDEARRAANKEHDKMLFEAQEEVSEMRRRASEEIEIARKNNEEAVKKQIIEGAVVLASKFMEEHFNKDIHNKYIEDALSADWSERK